MTRRSPIGVVLADDQELLRAGFRMVLQAQPDMTVVGEAGNGGEAVDVCASTAADVVLMDVRMPLVDGIEATRLIVEKGLATRVLILTTFDLDEYVVASLRAGASGFLLKDVPPVELLAAIRAVSGGDAVVAPRATRRLLDRLLAVPQQPPPDPRMERLTPRERDVYGLLARGRSNGEIAADLVVSELTVKTHVARILGKLELRDRVQAVVHAYESGLIRPGDGNAGANGHSTGR